MELAINMSHFFVQTADEQGNNEIRQAIPAGLGPIDRLAFLKADPPSDVLCIAGGSGISAVLSISRGRFNNPAMVGRKLHYFFGGPTPAAISEPKSEDGWEGPIGFVHDSVVQVLSGSLGNNESCLAGPPPVDQATTKMHLRAEGAPAEQVHFDRFF